MTEDQIRHQVRRELADEFEARARIADEVEHLNQAAFVWRQAARIAQGEKSV